MHIVCSSNRPAIFIPDSNKDVFFFSVVNSQGHTRFCWTETQKSWIKASFFYGYIAMQVFGGSLAEKFGTKTVLGLANSLAALMALFIPLLSKFDWTAPLVTRHSGSILNLATLFLTPIPGRYPPKNIGRSKI